MRLVGIDEAWEQYSALFDEPFGPPKEGVFIFQGDVFVAGCSIERNGSVMMVDRLRYISDEAAMFMARVLRAHERVTGRLALVAAEYQPIGNVMGLAPSGFYVLLKEETPQARKKETDPGETPHAEPTDQGGTAEDVPPAVVESKPRAWRKKVKK